MGAGTPAPGVTRSPEWVSEGSARLGSEALGVGSRPLVSNEEEAWTSGYRDRKAWEPELLCPERGWDADGPQDLDLGRRIDWEPGFPSLMDEGSGRQSHGSPNEGTIWGSKFRVSEREG